MKIILKIIDQEYFIPILICMIGIICYGLFSPFLGFYHDEFSLLWFSKKMGDAGIMFEGNRPHLKYIFGPFLSIFGSYHYLWVIFAILTRILSVLAIYWIIRQGWPEENKLSITGAVAFLVYPGFQAQFSSLMYGVYFLLYFCVLFSIGLSLFIIRINKYRFPLLFLSLLLSGISLFTSEYFFTLELIRYFLLWIVIRTYQKKTKFIKISAPYIALFLIATIWRLLVQEGETIYEMTLFESLDTSILQAIVGLFVRIISDMWFTSIQVWISALVSVSSFVNNGIVFRVTYFLSVVVVGISIYLYLRNERLQKNGEPEKPTTISLFTFYVLSMFFAGIPFWISGLPVNQPYYYTRWTIPFMIGGCLLIPFLIEKLLGQKVIRNILLSIILAFAAGSQILTANDFRREHQKLNHFFWQIHWRIPSLEEGTVFFSDMLDFHYMNSDHLSSGINFALSTKDDYTSIPYFLFYLPERYQTSVLPEIEEGIPLSGKRYYSRFKGSTSQAILIDYQPPGCLIILDPDLDQYNPNLDHLTKEALFLTKPDLITDSIRPDLDPFSIRVIGHPLEETWCYFFEKADAAFQFEDWTEVLSIFSEVESRGLKPRDGREWVPFVSAATHEKDFYTAAKLTSSAIEMNENFKPLYCKVWTDLLSTNDSPEFKTEIRRNIEQLSLCGE